MRKRVVRSILAVLPFVVCVGAFSSIAPQSSPRSLSIKHSTDRYAAALLTRSTMQKPRQRLKSCSSSVTSRFNLVLLSSTTGSSEQGDDDNDSSAAATETESGSKTLLQRIKTYFSPPDDGLTFRQRLAKMGLAAALSYGWVSNMSYSVSVSLAWYIFSKRTGMSPLAPGQWKGFLAVYAGFFVFNNLVRPIRLAIAAAISPQFEKVVKSIQDRFRVPKAAAVTITVVFANVFGTLLAMSAGILLASICAGVPIWATAVKK